MEGPVGALGEEWRYGTNGSGSTGPAPLLQVTSRSTASQMCGQSGHLIWAQWHLHVRDTGGLVGCKCEERPSSQSTKNGYKEDHVGLSPSRLNQARGASPCPPLL